MKFLEEFLSLPLPQRIASLVGVLFCVGMILFFTQQAAKPQLSLLYSGMDPADAGEVVEELESLGVAYEIRGQSIFADARRRDKLRMELARQGLPRKSGGGYEILDDMNSFAMTSEMYNTNYWRAKEGELVRTILTMPSVTEARVHIGTSKQSSFSRDPQGRSASVTVTSVNRFDTQQAKSVQYLVALAVSGLTPEDVAVIDTTRGLIAGPGLDQDGLQAGMGASDRASRLERSLTGLLEARVGLGNARVSVSMDLDRQRQTISERVFDPESRVLKSRQTMEKSGSSSGQGRGPVTVASNLPEGGAGAGSSSESEDTESSQTETYEISEVYRESQVMPGEVKRQTIAVLLNDPVVVGEDGVAAPQPRSEEELNSLRELIAAAAGLDEERGDVLSLQSMAYTIQPDTEIVSAPGAAQNFMSQHLGAVLQSLILAAVVVLLGMFVVKPLLTPSGATAMAAAPAPAAVPAMDEPLQLPANDDEPDFMPAFEMASIEEMSAQDPVDMLKEVTSEKPDDAATLLMSWLEEDEKVAS